MWFAGLIAYSLQIAVLISTGMLLCSLFRFQQPKARLAWLQIVLVASLLMPLWQPWSDPVIEHLVDFRLYTAGLSTAEAGGNWHWIHLVMFTLGAGVAARWLWLALGLLRLRRYRQRAQRLSHVPNSVVQLQSRLGVEPAFYLSNELACPLTFGFQRAVVLLPKRFPEMPEAKQAAIACHELCHVRRRDWLATLFEEVVRGLFWFHPFVGWLIRDIQLTREQVVDRQVVEITGSREVYLDALVEIAKARVPRAPAMAPSFLSERQVTRRVEALLREVRMSRIRRGVSAVIMSAVLVGVGQFSGWSFPLQSAGPSAAPTKDLAEKAQAFADAWSRAKELHPTKGESKVGIPPPKRFKGTTPPSIIHTVEPEYTEEARAAGLEGQVLLYVNIRPDGRAHDIRVADSLGLGLDEKAIAAMEQWRFRPGERNGRPLTVAAAIVMVFAASRAMR